MKKNSSVLSLRLITLAILTTAPVGKALAQLPMPANAAGEPVRSAPSAPAKTAPAAPPQIDEQPVRKSNPVPSNAKLKSVTVGGVSVRGLSDVAAVKKLKQAHGAKLEETITLWDGKTRHQLRRDALGASIPYYELLAEAREMQDVGADIPLRFDIDTDKTLSAMQRLATKVNHAPANASLDVENGQAVLRGGEGAEMAVEGSMLRVEEALANEPPQSYVELVVVRQPGTSTLRQFKYLLGEFSTPYDAGIRGRTTNLRMSAHNVNGTVVPMGELFSTNKAIGPRTGAGWREAKMFVNGEIVDGTGAGVCQCSTTIYNAALLANLPIVERHPHSFRVKYAPPSQDAAIYWGQKDMKWRNNTSGPIYVQTFLKNNRFYARLYGVEKVQAKVIVQSRVLSRRKGTSSEAYKIVQTSTGTTRRRLSRDYYKPH